MVTFVSFFLLSAALVFIGWPFFQTQEDAESSERPSELLERQKREAYAAIREAEFDLRMGKLTEADFVALKEQYSRQAMTAMAALEKMQARSRKSPAGSASKASFCPQCGARVPARARFCGGCGRALRHLAA